MTDVSEVRLLNVERGTGAERMLARLVAKELAWPQPPRLPDSRQVMRRFMRRQEKLRLKAEVKRTRAAELKADRARSPRAKAPPAPPEFDREAYLANPPLKYLPGPKRREAELAQFLKQSSMAAKRQRARAEV